MEEKEAGKEIELRSEEVQDVLGKVPHWIVRQGIVIIGIIILALLIGSYFFKYPDTVPATMTLTSTSPPASITAKSNGALKEFYISDGDYVNEKDYLAVIENPASTKEILELKARLVQAMQNPDTLLSFRYKDLQLGNVQEWYSAFIKALNNYQKFVELDFYPKKIRSIYTRIQRYEKYYESMLRQYEIIKEQYRIEGKQFQRDSLLLEKDMISRLSMENTHIQYLKSRTSLESSFSTLENIRIEMAGLHESLIDIERQHQNEKSIIDAELNTAVIQLVNAINTWELTYVLLSPFAGKITFTNYWSENQNVTSGETIFTVIPDKNPELVGKAMLPLARSGKVKTGQQANIYFANYPDEEYGMVKGIVKNISLVPTHNNYAIEITLPEGLLTTYKKELPFSPEMVADIEIITEDLRMIERIFLPIRKLLNNHL
jgi:HlyD family secretion protein